MKINIFFNLFYNKLYSILFRILFLFYKTNDFKPSLEPLRRVNLFKEIKIHNIQPANFNQISNYWKPGSHWFNYKTNNVNLNQFKNIFVSYEGIIFKRFNSFSGSYVYPEFFKKFGIVYILDNYKFRKICYTKKQYEYLIIYDHWSAFNYFHWLTDSMPKLLIYKNKYPQANVRLILPNNSPTFIKDSLNLFSLVIENIKPNEYLKVNNLTHVDYISKSGFSHPNLIELANTIKDKIKVQKGNRKIYLSRTFSNNRAITNEIELINLLVEYDFEICYAENISFTEQVKLFSEANVIISSHGAGLTNLMFMPEGSKVIEIGYQEMDTQLVCYWVLSNTFKHKYHYIPVESSPNDHFILKEKDFELINNALKI